MGKSLQACFIFQGNNKSYCEVTLHSNSFHEDITPGTQAEQEA